MFAVCKYSLDSAIKPSTPQVLRATLLLDQVREQICYKHYSLRTEDAYVQWCGTH